MQRRSCRSITIGNCIYKSESPNLQFLCTSIQVIFYILCFHILLQALTAYISFNHNAIQYSIITLSENTVCVFWCNDNILRWGCNMPTLNVRTQVCLNQKKCYRQVHGTTPIISRLMLVYRWSGSSCPSSQVSADVYPLSEQRFKHNQPSIIPCSSLTHHSHNTHTTLTHHSHTILTHHSHTLKTKAGHASYFCRHVVLFYRRVTVVFFQHFPASSPFRIKRHPFINAP